MDSNDTLDSLIEELEDTLEASWKLPLTGGRTVIDASEVKRIVEDLRLKYPQEIKQAKNIVADRNEIIKSAKKEAEDIIKIAEEKVRAVVNQSEIVRKAQAEANKILSDAKMQAREMRMAASGYVDDLMKRTDQILTSGLSEIRKSRQSLRMSDNREE